MNGWLSVTAVARELGVGAPLVYRLINNGHLIAYRFGRVYRVRGEDLAAYLESAKVKPGDLDRLVPNVVDLRAVEAS